MKIRKRVIRQALGAPNVASRKGLAIYGGLIETPTRIFPQNLHERLAFAAGSWRLRKEDNWRPPSGDIHDVFTYAFQEGYAWLGTGLRGARAEKLNPFPATPESLDERLRSVSHLEHQILIEKLAGPTLRYMDEQNYAIQPRRPENHLLRFLNYDARRMHPEAKAAAFAKEIARALSSDAYNWDFSPEEQRLLC